MRPRVSLLTCVLQTNMTTLTTTATAERGPKRFTGGDPHRYRKQKIRKQGRKPVKKKKKKKKGSRRVTPTNRLLRVVVYYHIPPGQSIFFVLFIVTPLQQKKHRQYTAYSFLLQSYHHRRLGCFSYTTAQHNVTELTRNNIR